MKKFLLCSLMLIGLGCVTSCSFFRSAEPARSSVQDKPSPVSVEKTAPEPETTAGAPSTSALSSQKPQSGPIAHSVLSLPPEDEEENEADGPAVLPGDYRPGLRTPDLPSTLLYDMDGKLTTPNAQ